MKKENKKSISIIVSFCAVILTVMLTFSSVSSIILGEDTQSTVENTDVVSKVETVQSTTPAASSKVEETTSTTPAASSKVEEPQSTTPAASSKVEETTSTTPAASSKEEETTSTTPATSSKEEETTSTTPATSSKEQVTTSTTPATSSKEQVTTSTEPVPSSKEEVTSVAPSSNVISSVAPSSQVSSATVSKPTVSAYENLGTLSMPEISSDIVSSEASSTQPEEDTTDDEKIELAKNVLIHNEDALELLGDMVETLNPVVKSESLVNIFTNEDFTTGDWLTAKFLLNALNEQEINEKDLKAINFLVEEKNIELASDSSAQLELTNYIKMEMSKLVGESESNLNTLQGYLTVTFDVPENIEGANREYVLVSVVDGFANFIYDDDNNDSTMTFNVKDLSNYAVGYIQRDGISQAEMLITIVLIVASCEFIAIVVLLILTIKKQKGFKK